MASSSSLNPFALKTLPTPAIKPHRNLSFPATISTSSFPSKKFPTLSTELASPTFVPRAVVVDDEGGKAKEESEPEAGGVALAEAAAELVEGVVVGEVGGLKKKLKELLHGTDRGLKASSETRAEIVHLITQLEAKKPTPAPTEALALLNGKWILAYTSFSQLFPLLGSERLPELVKVDEISQTIDSEALTVQNSVKFAGPLAAASITTNSKFEAQSPKLVQIKVEEGNIVTPQLTDSVVFPDKVEILGQNIDFSPLKGVISSISSVAETIAGQTPLKIPFANSDAQSWMLTTYLDGELRISRGNGSIVFVLIKEGSSLVD